MLQYELILASESPRRRQLLQEAGFRFTVHPTQISENLNKNLNVEGQIRELAGRKSLASKQSLLAHQSPGLDRPLVWLAADTMVVVDGQALGKPAHTKEAFETLRLLSGRSHLVITAISIRQSQTDQEISGLSQTEVQFRELSDDEIWSYIQTGEPMDKAGSYGIQGLGRSLVQQFQGSYTNVVGLPMEVVEPILRGSPFFLGAQGKI